MHFQFPALDLQKDAHSLLPAPAQDLIQRIQRKSRLQLCHGIVPDPAEQRGMQSKVEIVVDHGLTVGGQLNIDLDVIHTASQYLSEVFQRIFPNLRQMSPMAANQEPLSGPGGDGFQKCHAAIAPIQY